MPDNMKLIRTVTTQWIKMPGVFKTLHDVDMIGQVDGELNT